MTNQDGSIFVIRYKTVSENLGSSSSLPSSNADKEVIDSFLAGTNCLSGVTIIYSL
jgi:hypothetical protein